MNELIQHLTAMGVPPDQQLMLLQKLLGPALYHPDGSVKAPVTSGRAPRDSHDTYGDPGQPAPSDPRRGFVTRLAPSSIPASPFDQRSVADVAKTLVPFDQRSIASVAETLLPHPMQHLYGALPKSMEVGTTK